MTEFKHLSIKEKEHWDLALQGLNVSVYFTWQYCQIIGHNYSQEIKLLKITSAESGILVVYVSRSKDGEYKDIYSPYGMGGVFLWGDRIDNIIKIFKEWLAEQKIVTYFLMMHPKDFVSNTTYIEQYRKVYTLNITVPTDAIYKKMHSNHRYEINRIYNNGGFELIEDKEEIKHEFEKLYFSTLDRVKASETYYFTKTTLDFLFSSDIIMALGFKLKDEIKCIVVFLKHNDWAEYYINASTAEGRFASRLLIWETIKRLKEKGVSKINLGGGIVDGDHLDDFKRRFGGEPVNMGVFKGIALPKEYDKLCKDNKVSLDNNYFPPYWSK